MTNTHQHFSGLLTLERQRKVTLLETHMHLNSQKKRLF